MDILQNKIVIAIDGFSSCGKSTFAKKIAKKYNYTYVDSGAMYRAVTLSCIKHNIIDNNTVDQIKLNDILNNVEIDFEYDSEGNQITKLNGEDVENEIRSISVSSKVSIISSIGSVREKLVKLQQGFGIKKGIVMDGRDIGTAVFPDAELKIFMTADPKVRAKRRYDELIAKGDDVNYDDIEENIVSRDHLDQTREISPLVKADDAITLDNTYMLPEDQVVWLEEIINKL
ncbi:MAG: (d)CMP kinase [Bacteroidales bacterium]|jgi:cytidylate kinase|nr:(d)CMP kinase [Bacteroidales bacterium]